METVTVRYNLFLENGKGYPPYFIEKNVEFKGGLVFDDSGWYYGYLSGDDIPTLIEANSKFNMEMCEFPLEPQKAAEIRIIDEQNRILLQEGFEYDGYQFSMDDSSQRNWLFLGMSHSLGVLQYPVQILTIDNILYELSDSIRLLDFLGVAASFLFGSDSILKQNQNIKSNISEAVSISDVLSAATIAPTINPINIEKI